MVSQFARSALIRSHLINAPGIATRAKAHFIEAWNAGLKARSCAPESVFDRRGASPLQAYALRPVTNCNCVAVRRGEEQQKVKDQSVEVSRHRTRFGRCYRGACKRKANPRPEACQGGGKSHELKGSVRERHGRSTGGWRRNGPKVRHVNQGDLFVRNEPAFMQVGTLPKNWYEQETERS